MDSTTSSGDISGIIGDMDVYLDEALEKTTSDVDVNILFKFLIIKLLLNSN